MLSPLPRHCPVVLTAELPLGGHLAWALATALTRAQPLRDLAELASFPARRGRVQQTGWR